jgi:hypothetical protein
MHKTIDEIREQISISKVIKNPTTHNWFLLSKRLKEETNYFLPKIFRK